jgi:hypothetical protein
MFWLVMIIIVFDEWRIDPEKPPVLSTLDLHNQLVVLYPANTWRKN